MFILKEQICLIQPSLLDMLPLAPLQDTAYKNKQIEVYYRRGKQTSKRTFKQTKWNSNLMVFQKLNLYHF